MNIKDTKTIVVNLTRETYDVYIGRKQGHNQKIFGYFGNPFILQKHGTREKVIQKYKKYFYDRIEKDPEFKQKIESLKGKRLGCFCKPQKCHGTVILEWLVARFGGQLIDEFTAQLD